MSEELSERQTQELLALQQMMVMLTQIGGNYSQQRLLDILSIKGYINNGANYVAQLWVDKKLDKDDYHELMGHWRSAWVAINRIIEEDYELKQDYQIPITLKSTLKLS